MERLRLLVEGVNNKIRVLQRRAYGYRAEEYLKLKIVAAFLPHYPEMPSSTHTNPRRPRFILSIKSECLERMIFFSEQSLRRAVAEFIHHYHGERNHQGLGNALLEAEEWVLPPSSVATRLRAVVQVRKRLGCAPQ